MMLIVKRMRVLKGIKRGGTVKPCTIILCQ